MEIRLATEKDIPVMREVYNYGRDIQLKAGVIQWEKGYPSQELIVEDIEREAAYVCLNGEGDIVAVASVFIEPDPTYFEIEGAWLNDEPYATIHRIATNGQEKGVGQYILRWVQENHKNVRIDTHADNASMKYILSKLGFEYTGVIYIENGEARDAYHYVAEH